MDEFIDELLREERACDVILPRIQVRLDLSHYNYDYFRLCLHCRGPVPNRSGPKIRPDRPSVYTGPFWNHPQRIQTVPKLDLLFCRFSLDLDRTGPDRTGSRTVPCKQKPIQSSLVRNGSSLVLCKSSLRLQ